jgi:LmbE family N-acetylglucosaminyl deacetylase
MLLAFAHPDDESFLAAGLAIEASDRGDRVVLYCATRGEAARGVGPTLADRRRLARTRAAELALAAKALGIARVVLDRFADGGLGEAPGSSLIDALVRVIRRERPEVVVTFAPDGGNRHPDHMAISRAVSTALPLAADDRYGPSLGRPHRVATLLWTAPVMPWAMRGRAGELGKLAGVDVLVMLPPATRARKARALGCHRSQRAPIERIFGRVSPPRWTLRAEAFQVGGGVRPSK